MNHTKIILAFTLLVLFLSIASAADSNTDGNTTDSNGTIDTRYSICTDSDGGRDYYVKGDINWAMYDKNEPVGDRNGNVISEGNVSDFCTGTQLKEYYCDETNNVQYLDSYNCPDGCKDGVCIMKITYGSIKVTSNPSKASVYLDDWNYVGKTPVSLKAVITGSHSVIVKLRGYKDYRRNFEVKANRTTPVHAKLKKATKK